MVRVPCVPAALTAVALWFGAVSASAQANASSPTIAASNTAASQASDRRLIGLEDFYRLESVGQPAISPDGGRVAYVRTYPIEDQNRRNSEVWLVASDGSDGPIRLTHPSFSSSGPRWSPDGSLLAFFSARDVPETGAHGSVWFLRMDRPGGEAFQIEGVEGAPLFSPDGRRIAYTKETPPSVPRPEAEYASDLERQIDERFDGRVYDWMNYRFDRRGYLADPRDPFATPPDELYVVPVDGGEPRQLTRLGVDVSGSAWRPDAGALAFTADMQQRDEHTYERADLFVVATDGDVTRLTDDGFNYSSPSWSPDGRWIVVRGNEGLDRIIETKQNHGAHVDLFLFPADGGEVRNLTAGWDLMPGSPRFAPDGRHVYFTAGIGGNSHLFRVEVASGRVDQVTEGDRRLSGLTFSEDFGRVAYAATDPTHPGDVFTARFDGSQELQLTALNGDLLAQLELAPAERIVFPSRDGTEVEGWVLKPPGYDPTAGPYPMILNIHGGPHGAYGNSFSFQFQRQAAHGYVVVYTNPRGSTGYGEAFKWAIWGGWGGVDYEDLMAGVDHVLARYAIDERRLGVTGGSYGGFMTNWIITQTDRFAAAISRASISNWVSDYGTADIPRTKESEFGGPPWKKESLDRLLAWSPIVHADGVSTPTLFLHGEWDRRVPIEEAEQMYVALKKQKVPAKFIRYPDSYHGGWTPWRAIHSEYQQILWWDQYLKQRPATSAR